MGNLDPEVTMPEAARPRETSGRRGRAARRRQRTAAPVVFLPTLVREVPVYELLDGEGVELIHDASMALLENVGIEFRDEESLALWRTAGAEVDGARVRIARELLMELVGKAPETYTLHARNPERTVQVGGRNTVFCPAYGHPSVRDLEDKRRDATIEDFNNFAKLAYMSPALHLTGGVLCEPLDVPVPRRHLHMIHGLVKHSDKPFMGAVTSRERAEDSMRMAKIAFGDGFVDDNTVMTSLANCKSPLVWDATMLDAVKVYARHNQAVLLSPFALGGASTPASTVGTVAQLNAEALAGVAFMQVVRPGSPAVYGQATGPISMRTGAPMAGTPDTCHANLVLGQLVRRYRLPYRCSGMRTTSKLVDAQAGYEAARSMYSALLSGANFVLCVAGYLEGGMTHSYAKFVLDAEQMAMFYRFARGVSLSDLDEAMAAAREVGPGGHFLGTAHTRAHFETAFFMPELLDQNSYEQWQAEGARDANTRALETARQMLDRYEPPPLDPAIDEALRAFIRMREAELAAGGA